MLFFAFVIFLTGGILNPFTYCSTSLIDMSSIERGRGRGEGDDAAGFGVLRQEEGLAQRRQDARAGNGNRPEKGKGRIHLCLIILQAGDHLFE